MSENFDMKVEEANKLIKEYFYDEELTSWKYIDFVKEDRFVDQIKEDAEKHPELKELTAKQLFVYARYQIDNCSPPFDEAFIEANDYQEIGE